MAKSTAHQRTEPVAPQGRTVIDVSRYTRVRVEGTDGEEMTLAVRCPELAGEGIRRLLGSIEITDRNGGDRTRVTADGPRRQRERRFLGIFKRRDDGPWSELRVALPRGRAVELVLGPGTGAEVRGVEGGVEGSAVGSHLSFSEIAGGLQARVRGSYLRVKGVRGAVDLEVQGGDVRVQGAEGAVKARVTGGKLVFEAIRGDLEAVIAGGKMQVRDVSGSVEATASGGSIAVRQSAPPVGDHLLKAISGDVLLRLPAGSGGMLSARAARGWVTARLDGERFRDRVLERDLGGGGPRLDIRTNGGDVRVLRGSS